MPHNRAKVETQARPRVGGGVREAASVILLRFREDAPQIFWARRAAAMSFLGGFQALPGGARENFDAETLVENCGDANERALIACAARELFEETCIIVARGTERLTKGQRASLHEDLTSGRMTFPELLRHYGLHLDARDFRFAGRWLTPPFSPKRFDTHFFLVLCPPKQQPANSNGELEAGEWIAPTDALARWRRGEALMAEPLLHALRVLESFARESQRNARNEKTQADASDMRAQLNVSGERDSDELLPALAARLRNVPHAAGEPSRSIEFLPNIFCIPLRTPTLPPATHTNCYVVAGAREMIVIDPASPHADEQRKLHEIIDELSESGKRRVREILITHAHADHTGGVCALHSHLKNFGTQVSIAAHKLTAESLANASAPFRVTRFVEDGEIIELESNDASEPLRFIALHTPGHARGHLCFYDERTGALFSGDNVTGLPSVVINPPEGDVNLYLRSLERMKKLPRLNVILSAHGAPVANTRAAIERHIAHRLERERQILEAIETGAHSLVEIITQVYADTPASLHRLAARSVLAHVIKLRDEGRIDAQVAASLSDEAEAYKTNESDFERN